MDHAVGAGGRPPDRFEQNAARVFSHQQSRHLVFADERILELLFHASC
jgi:hypothetical protein